MGGVTGKTISADHGERRAWCGLEGMSLRLGIKGLYAFKTGIYKESTELGLGFFF